MAKEFYPGWQTVFYLDEETVPAETADKLEALGADIRLYSSLTDPNGMFVRFWTADDPNVERFLVRDVDSRPCQREVNAVQAWIESGRDGHICRDHPYHSSAIMGGMWGAVSGVLKGITEATKRFARYRTPYTREHAYGADQEFLLEWVWPKLFRSALIHDSFNRGRFNDGAVPFPDELKFGDYRFMGEVFDQFDQPDPVHWQMRIKGMVQP